MRNGCVLAMVSLRFAEPGWMPAPQAAKHKEAKHKEIGMGEEVRMTGPFGVKNWIMLSIFINF
jgi:hypothetical protein